MRLKQIEISGFKSFAKKINTDIYGTRDIGWSDQTGSGKSNVVESFRFVLGEQSMKSMRGKSGADLIFKGGPMRPNSLVPQYPLRLINVIRYLILEKPRCFLMK